ncbi:MAG: hypothetical protein IPI35_20415 [Deltaproteobacteria bacterium]|nr:hypothetical protein [Deltaproteobacteria bacterium]
MEARVAKRLRAVLSPASVAIVEDAMADGLAIYVYAYPGFPTRANAYGHLQAGESEAERLSRLNQLDVDATARSWVRLLVRALHLGFLPYTYQNEGLGVLDAGNACVDGGIVVWRQPGADRRRA